MINVVRSLMNPFCYGVMLVLISACSNFTLLPISSSVPNFETVNGALTPKQASLSVANYDLLIVNEQMQAFIDPYLSKKMPQRQRVKMLVTLLLGSGFLNMEYEINDTLTAEQAFFKESANCVGFSNLYIALARHYGIDARYQLIRKYPEWNRQNIGDQVMSLSIHINSLLKLPQGQQLIVDIIPEVTKQAGKSEVISDNTAKALFYNNLAIDHFLKHNYEKSYRLLVKAMTFDVTLDLLWVNLGAVFRHNDQLKEAEQVYKVALTINPGSYTAMNNLAVLYHKQENWLQYEFYLKKTNQYRQQNPYYHFQLALNAKQEYDYAEAIRHMLKAIKLKNNEPEFHKTLNKLYELSSNYHSIQEKVTKQLVANTNK